MKFSKPLFITVALLIALVMIVPAALVIPFAKAKVGKETASNTPPSDRQHTSSRKSRYSCSSCCISRKTEEGRNITSGGVCDRCSSF